MLNFTVVPYDDKQVIFYLFHVPAWKIIPLRVVPWVFIKLEVKVVFKIWYPNSFLQIAAFKLRVKVDNIFGIWYQQISFIYHEPLCFWTAVEIRIFFALNSVSCNKYTVFIRKFKSRKWSKSIRIRFELLVVIELGVFIVPDYWNSVTKDFIILNCYSVWLLSVFVNFYIFELTSYTRRPSFVYQNLVSNPTTSLPISSSEILCCASLT